MKDHDGCTSCLYESKSAGEYPCCECTQNYIDKWMSKDTVMKCNKVVAEDEDLVIAECEDSDKIVNLAKSLTELIRVANENISGINQDLFCGGEPSKSPDGIDCLMDQMRWNVNGMKNLLDQIDALKRALI